MAQPVRELPHDPRHAGAAATSGPTSPTSASRATLAALTIPNTPDFLAALDHGPAARQARQPHAGAGAQRRATSAPLVAYLESLR